MSIEDKFKQVECEIEDENGILYEVCKDSTGKIVSKKKLLAT